MNFGVHFGYTRVFGYQLVGIGNVKCSVCVLVEYRLKFVNCYHYSNKKHSIKVSMGKICFICQSCLELDANLMSVLINPFAAGPIQRVRY